MAKKESDYAVQRKRAKIEAAKTAEELRILLSNEPDWLLATDPVPKDYHKHLLAITRITKRAVKLMYPNHVCSVRRHRGTAYCWVAVNITMPELAADQMRGSTRAWEYKDVCRRVEDALVALGIPYSTYLPDRGPGLNERQPCLTVTVSCAC